MGFYFGLRTEASQLPLTTDITDRGLHERLVRAAGSRIVPKPVQSDGLSACGVDQRIQSSASRTKRAGEVRQKHECRGRTAEHVVARWSNQHGGLHCPSEPGAWTRVNGFHEVRFVSLSISVLVFSAIVSRRFLGLARVPAVDSTPCNERRSWKVATGCHARRRQRHCPRKGLCAAQKFQFREERERVAIYSERHYLTDVGS